MQPLAFEATVIRIARLAARAGGTVSGAEIEEDEPLSRDRATTSAAGHLLASGTNVVSTTAGEDAGWFPYGELTLLAPDA